MKNTGDSYKLSLAIGSVCVWGGGGGGGKQNRSLSRGQAFTSLSWGGGET